MVTKSKSTVTPETAAADDEAAKVEAAKADALSQAKAREDAAQAEAAAAAAKTTQKAADIAKQAAVNAQNDQVSEGIYTSGLVPGPSRESILGLPQYDDGSKARREATPKSVHSGDVSIAVTGDGTGNEILFLTRKAVELGILVDPNWGADRLRGEIQMAREGRADLQVKGVVPTSDQMNPVGDPATHKDKVQVVITRDYFPAEDQRVIAGSKITIDRAEAERLMDAGAAKYGGPMISA